MKAKNKICFISSSGGHFTQLQIILKSINTENYFTVTEKNKKISSNNKGIYYLKQFNRKNINFIVILVINLFISIGVLLKEKPDIIISTGAGATVPFCIMGKLLNKKIVYIESFAKKDSPTKTGKLMYRFADRFYVQWPEMLDIYPKAIYKGGLY